MPDKPTSREATDFFGNKKGGTEHFDESGEKTGESREATDFFGNKKGYTEHLDKTGDHTGESHEATDFFGNEKGYTEHFDADGNKAGETREATDFFGNKRGYVEHFDKSGRKIGETREATDLFGNKRGYVEHTVDHESSSRSSDGRDDSTDALVKLVMWLIAIGVAIFPIIMAIAITMILSPIWLGAVTAGVVSGYFLAIRVATRISNEAFSEAPVFEQKKGKGTRYRLHNTFFKGAVRFSPDVLTLIGITLLYCIGMAMWPFLGTEDVFTKVLLGVGVIAGVILGTMAGRRVLCWQLENLLFARANLKESTRLIAPKLALGFSIPGLIILAGGWICVLAQSSAPMDLAKEFGFKNNPPSRSPAIPGVAQLSTAAKTQSEAGVSLAEVRELLQEDYGLEYNKTTSELVVKMSWLVRYGAERWTVRLDALDLQQIRIGEPRYSKAFGNIVAISMPVRSGYSVRHESWNPISFEAADKWNWPHPADGIRNSSEEIEIYTKGIDQARQLTRSLQQLAPK